MHRPPPHAFLLAALLFLTGCWSYTPARPAVRATPIPLTKEAWPLRDESAVRPLLDSTPHEVFHFKLADGVDRAALSDDDRLRLDTPGCTVTYKGIHAASLLRI